MEHLKKVFIANVINFLNQDAQTGLSEEKKESAEVAAQCLETTYDLTNFVLKNEEKLDLLELISQATLKSVITRKTTTISLNFINLFFRPNPKKKFAY